MKSLLVVLLAWVAMGTAHADDPPPDASAPPPDVAVPVAAPAPQAALVVPIETPPALPPLSALPAAQPDRAASRNFAGSIQLDYLALAHSTTTPDQAFAGPTTELSLKVAMDLGDRVTANVKVCYACHGFEVGMAYFDLHASDSIDVRVGRFTPAFGSFPQRHDPANHSTSDKPLAYDMGRMVRFRDFNEGVLPAPYVDNGVEVDATHTFGRAQLDYAVYAIAGPKGNTTNFDFDFIQSRSGDNYYVDNNGQPTIGGRVAANLDLARRMTLTLGTSGMIGHYDSAGKLGFLILGGDATLQIDRTFVRAEYLARWTQFALGDDPATRLEFGPVGGVYSTYFFKDGYDLEVEHPIDRVSLIGRVDGLRRRGNVLAGSLLSNNSTLIRFTAGVAVRLFASLQLKTSVERYVFSDFADETAIHLGLAGPF